MPFTNVVRMPAYLQVAGQLRAAIVAGDLAPGQALPTERELSSTFGVGRTTVREALRVLQAEGLVLAAHAAPGRTIVAPAGRTPITAAIQTLLDGDAISEVDLEEVRCHLEAAALSRSTLDRAPSQWAEAKAALREMEERRDDLLAFHAADRRFHLALVDTAGNRLMSHVMAGLWDAIDQRLVDGLRALVADAGTAALDGLIAEHAEILVAAEACDGDRATDLVRSHVVGFYNRLLQLRSHEPH